MNFYKHDLAAYDGNTAHLSWDEDCAYGRLMRAYYRREAPLPHTPPTEVYRITRAATRVQRAAVDNVLKEFFERRDDGWHNRRCDEEIAAYRAQADTNRRIAKERTNRSRTDDEPPTNRSPKLRSSDVQNLRGSEKGAGFECDLSKKVLSQKPIEKSPQALQALQNPAWMFNIDHARLKARQLGIDPAGKTHQELKDAIRSHIEKGARAA